MTGKIFLAFIAIALMISAEGCFNFGKRGETRARGTRGGRTRRSTSFGEMIRYISMEDLPGSAGVGDLAKTQGGKNYIYTGDTYHSVIYHWRRISRNINFVEARLPFQGARDIHVQVVRIGTVNGDWTGEKRVALARRLLDKRLVSGHQHCGSSHYYNYILYARTYTDRTIPDCPLARPLAGVSVNEINSRGFYLQTSAGRQIVVSQIPFYTGSENSPPIFSGPNRSRSPSIASDAE